MSIGSGLQKMVGFGTSSSHGDQPSVGFEELAMPLFDSLYNFARWIARDSDDAEDLVQETYLKALRSFVSFQPGTNFRAWIFQILRNTFLSSRTRFERRMTDTLDSEEDGPELAVDTETPETILMNRSNYQLVQRAIDVLPVHYRETLLLCEVEEMSYQEIADLLSIPIGTVMSRLARARKAVRESLCSTPGLPPSAEVAQRAGRNQRVSIDQESAAEKDKPALDSQIGDRTVENCKRLQNLVRYSL
jgi:RNA polymerase sigma-70 factor, ECF subfamily